MKIWIDDVRSAPDGYVWLRSVEEAKLYIGVTELKELMKKEELRQGLHTAPVGEVLDSIEKIELIDIDHDAGEYIVDGGNYIDLLNWLEARGRMYQIRIHSQDDAVVKKMREIIKRNGWREII